MKKVLSFVLVIAMVLSSMSFAFAGTFEDVTGDYEDAVNALVALGIVQGYEDGTFRPERVVTRAEMAKMLVETLGYGELTAGAASGFADTDGHWADKWIAIAVGTELVVGYPDGTFKPDATVSYDEVLTMVVRALGYKDEVLKGNWPTNFKVKALDLGLTDDVKMAAAGADRGGVAQVLYNALGAFLVEVDADNKVTYVEDENGKVQLLSKLAKKTTIDEVLPKHVDPDNKAYYGDVVDLTPYMYEEIEVFVKNDEVVFVAESNTDVVRGKFDADKDTKEVVITVDDEDETYKLATSSAIKVYYNGEEVEMTEEQMEATASGAKIRDLVGADVKAILDEDDQIVKLVADKATNAFKVTKVYNGKTPKLGSLLLPEDDGAVDFDNLSVIGAVDALEDIEEDDVVVVYAPGGSTENKAFDKLTLEVVRDTVEGQITRVKDGKFLIGGTYYEESEFFDKSATLAIKLEGVFFLDHNGDIVSYEEAESDEPVDYAVVTEIKQGYAVNNGTDADPKYVVLVEPKISLVNAAGEEVTYVIDEDAELDDKDLLGADGATISPDLKQYAVIKYTVKNDKITDITLEANEAGGTTVTASNTDVDTTKSSFVLANNVLVFNYDGEDVVVVSADDLGDKIDIIDSVKNSNGEYELLFVKGLGETEGTYAFIVEAYEAINDDEDEVQEIVAYVDGVETVYLTTKADTVTSSAVDTGELYKLTFDGSAVKEITLENPVADLIKVPVTKISGNRIQVEVSKDTYKWFTLAEDAVVYVLDSGEFDSVGDSSELYIDAVVTGYALDSDDTELITTLFLFD